MDDFEETVRRLREVNDIISSLDAAIRAAAFELLRPYVAGAESDVPGGDGPTATTGRAVDGGVDSNSESESLRKFLAKHRSDKPSENVLALAAFKYSRDGLAPFKAREIQEMERNAVVAVPARIHRTLEAAYKDGKPQFRRVGRGLFKPTVSGERYLQKEFGVKKGRRRRGSP